jgi:hypothetical protein
MYEDNRAREEAMREEQAAREAQAKAQAQAQAQARQTTPQRNQNVRSPNDELRPLPPTRAPQVKSREERLGLGAGGSSRG